MLGQNFKNLLAHDLPGNRRVFCCAELRIEAYDPHFRSLVMETKSMPATKQQGISEAERRAYKALARAAARLLKARLRARQQGSTRAIA